MIVNVNGQINSILLKTKPSNMTIEEYKRNLLAGKATLSLYQQKDIIDACNPVIKYGNLIAGNKDSESDEISSFLALGALNSNNIKIDSVGSIHGTSYYRDQIGSMMSANETHLVEPLQPDSILEISWGNARDCAAASLGIDALWALGTSSSSSWSLAALRTVFTKAASRFLGPVGVGIAVVSFTYCILKHGANELLPDSEDSKDKMIDSTKTTVYTLIPQQK